MFSVLSSKIFGGTTLLMVAAFALLLISKNAVINSQNRQIRDLISQTSSLRSNLNICRGNEANLEGQLTGQNAKVKAAADAANMVAKAGVAAVAQAQKAGAGVAAQVARINALPEATCADVDNILLEGAK